MERNRFRKSSRIIKGNIWILNIFMDTLTSEQRHKNMSHIRSKETKPEKLIRKALFKMGFRFRKNDKRLDGKPDVVLPRYHAVIFVNGCFWHGHTGCPKFVIPKTNSEFWISKINNNKVRDEKHIQNLIKDGWRVAIVWECSITGKKRNEKVNDIAAKLCYWLEESPDELRIEL